VAYLGEMETSDARGLAWSVEDVARSLRAPELALPGLGALGGRTEPRVVYAALTDPDGYCRDLHADLHDALGERAEPTFLPHITLCRPRAQRSVLGHTWRELLEAHGLATWGGCAMSHLALMVTDPHGSLRYRELERWALPLERRAAGDAA
jgi:2'-5' RNA ligase